MPPYPTLQVSTQVHFHRVLQYLVRTICRRLSVTLTCGESSGAGLFLPIPLNQCRVLERLGAITMVCFVDDDIICENYSVTEEIFLLVDHKNHDHDRGGGGGGGGGLRRGAHGQRSAAADQHSHSQAHSQPAFIRTGLVLDLHGSPEATGSRFENPEWWRYLPSLKPLGLNALLTYSATDTDTGMGDLTSAAAAPSQTASPQPLLPLTAHTAPTPPIHPSTQQSLPRPGPRGPRGQTGLAPDGESHLPPSFLPSFLPFFPPLPHIAPPSAICSASSRGRSQGPRGRGRRCRGARGARGEGRGRRPSVAVSGAPHPRPPAAAGAAAGAERGDRLRQAGHPDLLQEVRPDPFSYLTVC